MKLIDKYTAEQTELKEKITTLMQGLEQTAQAKTDVDEFIRRLKMYFNSPTLTREMCYELIDRIIIGAPPKGIRQDRIIEIVYKIDIASVLRHKLSQ